MKITGSLIILFFSIVVVNSCTYWVDYPPATNNCNAEQHGFPDIPEWSFNGVPVDSLMLVDEAYFLNEQKGFVYDFDGGIWKTENAGGQWEKVYSAPVDYITAMFFYGDLYGFGSGRSFTMKNCLIKTIDGGKNWQTIYYTPEGVIQNFCFIDSLTGFATFETFDSGVNFSFVKTLDGGLSWNAIPGIRPSYISKYLTPGFMISPVKIFPDGFGYVSGDTSQVYLTYDHGQTWTAIQTGLERLMHCQFINADIGFASGLHNLVKTIDGGKTWTIISEHPAIMIYFFNELEGVTLQTISSDFHYSYESYREDCNAFLTTTDGGLNWIEGPPSEDFIPEMIQFIDNHTAISTSSYKPGIVKYFK